MTYKELGKSINGLSEDEQNQVAKVYPPNECPALEKVPIVSVEKTASGEVVISTGKKIS